MSEVEQSMPRLRQRDRGLLFEFTEIVTIHASRSVVWEVMTGLENWWLASNPEHQSLERLDDRSIEVGARLRIREKIEGVPAGTSAN